MCGIAGFNGQGTANPHILQKLGLLNMSRGIHSSGLAVDFDPIVKTAGKDKGSFFNFLLSNPLGEDELAQANNVMIHTRHATQGAHTVENAHPFRFELPNGDVAIFMHNGTITNVEELRKEFKVKQKYEVDSQTLGHILVNKNFKVFEKYTGAAACAFYFESDPETMYLWNGASWDNVGTYNKKTNKYEKGLFSERELHYVNFIDEDGNKQFYFSSEAMHLYVAMNPYEVEVKTVPFNTLIRVRNGRIISRKPYNRDNFQLNSYANVRCSIKSYKKPAQIGFNKFKNYDAWDEDNYHWNGLFDDDDDNIVDPKVSVISSKTKKNIPNNIASLFKANSHTNVSNHFNDKKKFFSVERTSENNIQIGHIKDNIYTPSIITIPLHTLSPHVNKIDQKVSRKAFFTGLIYFDLNLRKPLEGWHTFDEYGFPIEKDIISSSGFYKAYFVSGFPCVNEKAGKEFKEKYEHIIKWSKTNFSYSINFFSSHVLNLFCDWYIYTCVTDIAQSVRGKLLNDGFYHNGETNKIFTIRPVASPFAFYTEPLGNKVKSVLLAHDETARCFYPQDENKLLTMYDADSSFNTLFTNDGYVFSMTQIKKRVDDYLASKSSVGETDANEDVNLEEYNEGLLFLDVENENLNEDVEDNTNFIEMLNELYDKYNDTITAVSEFQCAYEVLKEQSEALSEIIKDLPEEDEEEKADVVKKLEKACEYIKRSYSYREKLAEDYTFFLVEKMEILLKEIENLETELENG